MVFTDQLIKHIKHDEYILAIALHEKAHLDERHTLELLFRNESTGLLSFVLIGDLAGGTETVAQIALVFMSAQFSQETELETDNIAATNLKTLGFSPSCISEALHRLDDYYRFRKSNSLLLNKLSSHPDMEARIKAIEQDVPSETICRPNAIEGIESKSDQEQDDILESDEE